MTDFAAERRNMVDGQVRTADVTDPRIITAMLEVPRERFVPPDRAGLAYLDIDLPLGAGRAMIKPMLLGKLLQAADIDSSGHVLDLASGSGYGAAILAQVAGSVVALEENATLAAIGRGELATLPNVISATGPLSAGWPAAAPYDAILIEGASEISPQMFCRDLKQGGRLVCVLGSGPGARAMLYRRSGEELAGRPLFDAAAPLLPGFDKKPVFAF